MIQITINNKTIRQHAYLMANDTIEVEGVIYVSPDLFASFVCHNVSKAEILKAFDFDKALDVLFLDCKNTINQHIENITLCYLSKKTP